MKSINNHTCISECFKGNTLKKHPYTGKLITVDDNYCFLNPAVYPHQEYDLCRYYDVTSIATAKDYLSTIYNINSFDDAVTYVKKEKNKYTIKKILKNAFGTFGYLLIDNVTNNIIDYYKNLLSIKEDTTQIHKKINNFIKQNKDKWNTSDNHYDNFLKYLK